MVLFVRIDISYIDCDCTNVLEIRLSETVDPLFVFALVCSNYVYTCNEPNSPSTEDRQNVASMMCLYVYNTSSTILFFFFDRVHTLHTQRYKYLGTGGGWRVAGREKKSGAVVGRWSLPFVRV